MKQMKNLFFIGILGMCFSCASMSKIALENKEKASVEEVHSGDKTIRLIGMIHTAKPEFYSDVEEKVIQAKEEGYVLFYEFVDFDVLSDTNKRKARKFLGILPTPEIHDKYITNDKLVVQDNNQFLGKSNNLDFRVDYTGERMIQEYENEFGEIQLDSEDLRVPLDQKITNTLPQDNVFKIVLNNRNNYLVKKIKESDYKKIIVLYGLAHIDGIKKQL